MLPVLNVTSRGALSLLAGVLLAGCTSAGTTYETTSRLPRPDVIVIEPFAASPDEIKLSEGVVAQVEQMAGGSPRTPDEREVGRQVAAALADKLAVEIRDLGLPAQVGSAAPPQAKTPLLIRGQLTSINEGNEAERVVIGLGAGRSDVRVQAQVYEGAGGSWRVVEELEVDANSGLTPGMLEISGAGLITHHLAASLLVGGALHVTDEEFSTDVVADADRAAKGLAKQLAAFFGQQGWTP